LTATPYDTVDSIQTKPMLTFICETIKGQSNNQQNIVIQTNDVAIAVNAAYRVSQRDNTSPCY